MLTLLFGVDVLTSGWITSLFLAILLAFFFGQTQIYQSIVQALEETAQNRCKFCVRWAVRITVVGVLGGVLAIILSLEPVPNSALAPMFKQTQNTFWEGENLFILDDFEVTFIIMVLLLVMMVTNKLYNSLYRRIEAWGHYHFRTIRIQKLDLLTRSQIAAALIQSVKTTQYALYVLVISISTILILSLYVQTSDLSQALIGWFTEIGESLWEGIQAILPNLLMLALITVLTRWALKMMGFFYEAIWKGKIWVNSVHKELVEPTYQLLRLLVITFALVAAFPYIPGSSSPVFKAISIFAGFLLSLGSTSLASNIISGIVLTYTRGLRIGDRVQVAEAVGDVIERTLLVTRIRTIKNEVITLPNAKVMQNQVNNYSADAENNGLILHTTVTIGYDVPWRQVDNLLVQAALQTPNIQKSPAPFVLKTSLDDSYISYELNAYTDQAQKMAETYSNLHENILDEFNRDGVEIMSPAYLAVRDGQPTTIPKMEMARKYSRGRGNGSPDA
jgi:small-conductance mechanosensitive channel